jgi:hypothetical protein
VNFKATNPHSPITAQRIQPEQKRFYKQPVKKAKGKNTHPEP